MPGRPKEQKLLQTLRERAQVAPGDGASATDYVVSWVASGKTITKLAEEMAEELGEPVSRSWLAGVVNRRPEDKARIAVARLHAEHGETVNLSLSQLNPAALRARAAASRADLATLSVEGAAR